MDAHANFSYSTVLSAPNPAASGLSLSVAVGTGVLFPAAPFNCTVWPAGAVPTSLNAEIVRVTVVTGDTLTIVRQQEGTTARAIIAGDQIAATVTAKTLTDVEAKIPKTGTVQLGDAAESGAATGCGLAFTPSTVLVNVRKPANGLNLFASVVTGTITTDGFSFTLSAATDAASGYSLDWLAIP